MSFQITVYEIKPRPDAQPGTSQTVKDVIYEQTVDALEPPKLIAAVNYKKRVRKPKTEAAR